MKHTPLLLDEVLEALQVQKGKRYIDATAGQLGHLNKIRELGGDVLGIDYDLNQIEGRTSDVKLVHGNFADIGQIAQEQGFAPVDGIVFDLGISYAQLAAAGKGLSYKNTDERLDMRISDPDGEDAASFIKRATEDELYSVFARFGEEPLSRKIAHAVVRTRELRKVETVGKLREIIDKVSEEEHNTAIYSRIFQALRMFLNDEIDNVKKGFGGALQIVKSGGVVVFITFNSGEDRVVKQLIQKNSNEIEKSWKVKKKRPRSFERSAMMRVIVKK